MAFIHATATSTFRSGTGQFIAGKITPAVRAGVKAFGDLVLQEAQAIVPVDTGELRDSGKVVMEESAKRVIAHVVFSANHAAYIEFGTGQAGASSPGAGPYSYSATWKGMPARPYLRPALDTAREAGKALFASQVAAEFKF